MKVLIQYGDPMFPRGQKTAEIDTFLPWDMDNLRNIRLQLKSNPHFVSVGANFGDGLNVYKVLQFSGPRFHPGDIYTSSEKVKCLPIQVVTFHSILGFNFYQVERGYQGETKVLWKSEFSLMHYLKGHWWFSWLPWSI